ncbi:unnamed protein product, partial [Rotaria sp. Silwood2]
IDFLCGTEIWGILAQMATEDGLLLGLRIVAVIKFDASTLENLFFVVEEKYCWIRYFKQSKIVVIYY